MGIKEKQPEELIHTVEVVEVVVGVPGGRWGQQDHDRSDISK